MSQTRWLGVVLLAVGFVVVVVTHSVSHSNPAGFIQGIGVGCVIVGIIFTVFGEKLDS